MKKITLIIIASIAFINSFGQVKQNDQTKLEYYSYVGSSFFATVTNKQPCEVKFVLRNCLLDTIVLAGNSSQVVELKPGINFLEAKALNNCREAGVDVHGVVLYMYHVLAIGHFTNFRSSRNGNEITMEFDVSGIVKNTEAIIQTKIDGVKRNVLVFVPANNSHVTKVFTVK